ncbi:tyrosine-type recombinase/integrase [Comamonas sp. 26]|uniref:tyrosine-type recombinase/integrase n=1 Tax=Comamonas sp. 26 TaxID=2035201 RepID=UPI000C17A984|nr:tyrosine-type recombinase/integrase [Comamonas sp. 26]PIG09940.1 phage integrase family protein [Comamonas sp. 26]
MASVRETRTGRFELTIRNKLLPKPVYLSFDTREAAETYGKQCDMLLAGGVVPPNLINTEVQPKVTERLRYIIGAWMDTGQPAKSDLEILRLLQIELGKVLIADVNYKWAEAWVKSMKLDADKNYAPSTIRKRIGSLSRCFDWWLRHAADVNMGNPLKLLPRGLASYNGKDRQEIEEANANAKPGATELAIRMDISRERRLFAGEEDKLLRAMAGEKRPDRERALSAPDMRAMSALFSVIVWTGLRLREAYTLTRGQVMLDAVKLRVRTSKQWHGAVKWREVPVRPELLPVLRDYLATLPDHGADQLIFPFWGGEEEEMVRVSNRLSNRFKTVFAYAGCEALTEHDLRHEATCRWYEMRHPKTGDWMFREIEIPKIMGWAPGSKMPQRYASFRAEDLAARMYG